MMKIYHMGTDKNILLFYTLFSSVNSVSPLRKAFGKFNNSFLASVEFVKEMKYMILNF
jgi:hypothetical protein